MIELIRCTIFEAMSTRHQHQLDLTPLTGTKLPHNERQSSQKKMDIKPIKRTSSTRVTKPAEPATTIPIEVEVPAEEVISTPRPTEEELAKLAAQIKLKEDKQKQEEAAKRRMEDEKKRIIEEEEEEKEFEMIKRRGSESIRKSFDNLEDQLHRLKMSQRSVQDTFSAVRKDCERCDSMIDTNMRRFSFSNAVINRMSERAISSSQNNFLEGSKEHTNWQSLRRHTMSIVEKTRQLRLHDDVENARLRLGKLGYDSEGNKVAGTLNACAPVEQFVRRTGIN